MSGIGARPRGGWVRARWSDEHELAHAINGTIVGAAVMVAAGAHGTLGQVVISVVGTLTVYWAAERYAEMLAVGVHKPQHGQRRLAVLRNGWPMLESSYVPLIVLLVTSALGADLHTAVLTALGLSTVLLAGLGYVAARDSGAPRAAALGWGAVSALFGVAVIALKFALH